MQQKPILTYNGVSYLPLILSIPFIILAFSDHWAYDEAWSYIAAIDTNPWEIITYSKFKYANNHVLNTLYFYYLQLAGVKSIFLYRLPAVLSFFIYYHFISRLLKSEEGYAVRHLDQLVLYLWPYSVYFFQGRGYGLAMASFVGALFFFKQYLKGGLVKHLLYFVLLGVLSSVSLFSFLFPFVAMVIILGISRFSSIIKSPVRILVLALYLPVMWYIYDKGSIVNEYDTNIIGSNSLLQGGTISSLISFSSIMDFVPYKVFITFKVMITGTLLTLLYIFIKRKKWYVELSVIAVTLLLFVLSYYLVGAQYPMYRGVAYLILLVYLPFVYSHFKKNKMMGAHFVAVLIIGVTYVSILFYYTAQKSTKDVLADVSKDPHAILFEDIHRAGKAVNHMFHNDTLQVINCPTDSTGKFMRTIDTVKYVLCSPQTIDTLQLTDKFELQYKVATFLAFDKAFYIRKQD